MTDKPALIRYVAQVARIRIETTIVDINIEADATDDEVRESFGNWRPSMPAPIGRTSRTSSAKRTSTRPSLTVTRQRLLTWSMPAIRPATCC